MRHSWQPLLPFQVIAPVRARASIRRVQVQQTIVKRIYGLLEATADGGVNVKPALSILKQEVRLAAKTKAWVSWPFPAQADTKLARDHDLADLLFAAFHNQELTAILQLLHVLVLSLPASELHSGCQLETFLDHLTMASRTPSLPARCTKLIQDMVDVLAPVQLAEQILFAAEQPLRSAPVVIPQHRFCQNCKSYSALVTHAAMQS